jgi:uncharacterized iron-regulated membrane protein
MGLTAAPRGEATLVQRALGGHAAIGLLAGALLYLVMLSGTLAVIGPRWDRWEQPRVPEMTSIAPVAVQRAVAQAARTHPATIMVTLPTADLPRTAVTVGADHYYVDRTGQRSVLVRHGWTDFLLALHIYLNLPATIGLILVGTLGVMMAALSITGVIAHPRIFRDAFRLRPRANRQLAQADWHNRLGVWTLPFGVAIAITGAFLGLAVAGATLLAREHHGGDIAKVYAPIFGDQSVSGAGPAPIADVAAALATMRTRFPAVSPGYVTVAAPGTAGQRIDIIATVSHRLIYGESYRFDAAGRFWRTVGLADGALGQQVAASTYRLHFGSFGDWPVELAYLVFGLCLTVIAGTGTSLWLHKRRRRGVASPRLEAIWGVVLWGSPLLLVAVYPLTALAPGASAAAWFWATLAIGLACAAIVPARISPPRLRCVLAVSLVALGLAHALSSGAGGASLAIDAALFAAGAAILRASRVPTARRLDVAMASRPPR